MKWRGWSVNSEVFFRWIQDIRGDGTSGLYRLGSNDIVLNSEKIRIETRDRFRSERIINTVEISRHNRAVIRAILSVIGFAKLNPGNLCQ